MANILNSSYISVPIFNTKSSIDEKAFATISAKYYKDRKLPNVSKNLIIRENNLGEKTYEIYTYIPEEKKYKDSKIKNYWGYTLILDINEIFLRGFVVKDNKISSKILKSNVQKALKVSCEGWVEVITWQEPLVGEAGVVLHTLTINHPGDCGYNNDEDQAAGNSGDQGGSEQGTGSDECYASLEALANNTSPSNATISETIISNSGGLVEKKYIWKALNGPLWHVESTENAVINTNTNMFESLTHEKAEIVGIAALTTLMSHSITCNPLPSEPSTYKVVTLYFTIGYGLVFENNSCAITRSYNQPKILYPNL